MNADHLTDEQVNALLHWPNYNDVVARLAREVRARRDEADEREHAWRGRLDVLGRAIKALWGDAQQGRIDIRRSMVAEITLEDAHRAILAMDAENAGQREGGNR